MATIELVTFDMGNVLTIVDNGPPTREYTRLSGKTDKEVYEACYSPESQRLVESELQSWPDFVRQVQQALELNIPEAQFTKIFNTALTPIPAMFDVVEHVAQSHRIALCSNTDPPHWELERERLPFGRKFDPAIVSYEVGAMKPSPLIYEALSRSSKVPPDRILFIDDSIENVKGARQAGLNAVQFVGVEQLKADLLRFGVDV